jgi:transcriptional regulator with XRE-family HTH domain
MFKNRVREIRKAKGMTLNELAEKTGMTYSACQKIDAGTVDLDTKWMNMLSKVFDVEPWELLPKEMQPNITPEEAEVLRAIRKAKAVTTKTDEVSQTTKAS